MELKELFQYKDLFISLAYDLKSCLYDEDFFMYEEYYKMREGRINEKLEKIRHLNVSVEAEVTKNLMTLEETQKDRYEKMLFNILNTITDDLKEPFDLKIDNDGFDEDYYSNENVRFKAEIEVNFNIGLEEFRLEEKRAFIIDVYDSLGGYLESLGNNSMLVRYVYKEQMESPTLKKDNLIKWKSSPSHFGYIINELINKGYFDNLPKHNGETNYSAIARLFSTIINFDTSEQILLKSFNPNDEKMSDTKKAKFDIPIFGIPTYEDIRPKNTPKPKTSATSIKANKKK